MRSTYSTQVYCRQSKANKQGLSPLELSIVVNQKRVFLNLPYRAKASEFNRKRRPKELQEYVDITIGNVNSILLEMARNGVPVTASALKEYIKSGGFRPYTVNDAFDDYFHLLRGRIGIDISQGAYRRYEIMKDIFNEFHGGDKELTTVTNAVVQEFYVHLQQKYSTATAASYIARFKAAIVYAIDGGHLRINPFAGLKVKHERKPIDFLTEEEIDAIRNADLQGNQCLEHVRECFLLQVYSGLSFIDLEHLKEDDIMVLDDGTHYICKNRVKTGVNFTSIILPEGVEILIRNDYRMKVISNQKTNLYLKQIMNLAGISHSLTTHLGRKTYGHILLNRGVRIETVARALGHSNSKTTQKYYAEVTTDTVVREVVQSFS